MDHIISQLDALSELTPEQVDELHDSIISEFDTIEAEAPTVATVEAMTQLADAIDAVRGEKSRRAAEADELSARAAEASTRVRGEDVVEEAGEELDPDKDPAEDVVEEVEDEIKKNPNFAAEAETAAVTDEVTLSTEEATPVVESTEPAAELSVDETAVVEAPAEAELSVEETPEVVIEEPAAELAVEEPVVETVVEEPAAELAVDETPETEAVADVEVEAEASNIEEETPIESETQEEAQTVTAAADETVVTAPADRRPVAQVTTAPVAITAGADIPGYTAGSSMSTMDDVSEAMAKRLHSLRRVNGGDGEQHIVASITTEYPDNLVLGQNAEENSAKLENVVGPKAIMASGGFRAPLEASYDIFGFGSDVRPVRDSLPRFQADRGGIRFITPPVLGSYAGAVGIWTNQNDIDAAGRYDGDAGTPDGPIKNTLVVGGAAEQTEMTYAVTLQLQFGNLMTRAYPELIARHNELALIQHARLAELTLLSKINSKSTAVTTTSIIGFARDFLVNIKRAAVAYRSRHRIDPSTQLRAIIPTWVVDAMASDLALAMPGDDKLGVTRADINSYLALSNVSLTESLDQNSFGAQSAGALLEFPDQFTWYLFSEGSFVFLDGGTLDLGIIRDSGLVNTNDYKMFTETFEGLAFVGIESLAITSTISVNGVAAALRDTTGGATAAAVEY